MERKQEAKPLEEVLVEQIFDYAESSGLVIFVEHPTRRQEMIHYINLSGYVGLLISPLLFRLF